MATTHEENYVACAAILGLLEILDRFRRKERHSGEGYRIIDDIYSPAFYAAITRTGYLDATALSMVGVQSSVGSLCLIFAPLLGALIVPQSGILTDRYGRVIVYRGFAIFQLLIAFPVWWVLSLGNVVAIIIVISIALAVGTWGMFGAQGRYCRSCSVPITGT